MRFTATAILLLLSLFGLALFHAQTAPASFFSELRPGESVTYFWSLNGNVYRGKIVNAAYDPTRGVYVESYLDLGGGMYLDDWAWLLPGQAWDDDEARPHVVASIAILGALNVSSSTMVEAVMVWLPVVVWR